MFSPLVHASVVYGSYAVRNDKRIEKVKVTGQDIAEHRKNVQQRSSSPELDEWLIGQKVMASLS